MSDTYYPIPENPSYNEQIRKLKNSDPANATTVFNPLIEQLVENTHHVKKTTDTNSEHITVIAEHVENLLNSEEQRTNVLFATCSTLSSNPDKVINIESGLTDFGTGSIMYVRFKNANCLKEITLNVNNTGAKSVSNLYYDMHGLIPYWPAESIIKFIYYSSRWNMCSFNECVYPCIKVLSSVGDIITLTNGKETFTQTVNSFGYVNFYVHTFGEWTVQADSHGSYSKTINVDTVKIYEIRALPLSACAWSLIDEYSKAGKASDMWSIGDEKDITVGDETLTLVIVGFNHDNKSDGTGKAGITFGLKNLMATTRRMEATDTNANGFKGSEMYTWLQSDLLTSLPQDLQSVLKFVDKKTSAGNKSKTINTDSMKIFFFSEVEAFGDKSYSAQGEGAQYPYFATATNRKKQLANGTGLANAWWERSPYVNGSSKFCCVASGGYASFDNLASSTRGVCFGFCV